MHRPLFICSFYRLQTETSYLDCLLYFRKNQPMICNNRRLLEEPFLLSPHSNAFTDLMEASHGMY